MLDETIRVVEAIQGCRENKTGKTRYLGGFQYLRQKIKKTAYVEMWGKNGSDSEGGISWEMQEELNSQMSS